MFEAPATGLTNSRDATATPKAAKTTTRNPRPEATDPMLKRVHQIEHLWDAEEGAQSLGWEAKAANERSTATLMEEHRRQIVEWRNALELASIFTVAGSMAGATTQMAMVVCELQSVFDTLDLGKAGEMEPHLAGTVERCQRMIHSALDVMIAALGDDYAGYLRIVSTYAVAGEPHLNWLCDTASALCQCRRRKKAPPELAGPCDSQYIRDLPRRSSVERYLVRGRDRSQRCRLHIRDERSARRRRC